MKTPDDDTDETKEYVIMETLKILNNIEYNELILSQEDMV